MKTVGSFFTYRMFEFIMDLTPFRVFQISACTNLKIKIKCVSSVGSNGGNDGVKWVIGQLTWGMLGSGVFLK